MTLEFDPNASTKEPKPRLWATYIPTRSPKFKTHTNIGHAKNALNGIFDTKHEGILYEFRDGEWVEIDRLEASVLCAHCVNRIDQRPWPLRCYDGKSVARAWILHSHPASPGYKKPVVCSQCYDTHFDRYNKQATHPINVEDVGKIDLPEGMMT